MSDQQISKEQQIEIAHKLMPHAFDSQQALAHVNALAEPLGLRFGHEPMHHADLAKNLKQMSEAGHFHHDEIARVTHEVTGISMPHLKS